MLRTEPDEGCLRLVLGDQLSEQLSSLRDIDLGRDVVLIAEVMSEATYVSHHKQKFVLIFSAMRQFAQRLREAGAVVRYVHLDDPDNTQTLSGEVLRALERHSVERVVVTEPGEWRLAQDFEDLAHVAPIPIEIRPDDRFICSRGRFMAWAEGRLELRMEFFYREMRRGTGFSWMATSPLEAVGTLTLKTGSDFPKGSSRRPVSSSSPIRPR